MPPSNPKPERAITRRQAQYLAHRANGRTVDEIASAEFVTAAAVKKALRRARKNLDAATAHSTIALAVVYEVIRWDLGEEKFLVPNE